MFTNTSIDKFLLFFSMCHRQDLLIAILSFLFFSFFLPFYDSRVDFVRAMVIKVLITCKTIISLFSNGFQVSTVNTRAMALIFGSGRGSAKKSR